MSTQVILEFGSHSLKVHYRSRSSGIFRKIRYAWGLGHEVYQEGRISRQTTEQAVTTIEELRQKGVRPDSIHAIATGALRDAENGSEFLSRLQQNLGLSVRVITGREEASLLAEGYLERSRRLPALIGDIGGGSLELVYIGEDRTLLRDSLPLGAIRLHHFGADDAGDFDRELVARWIDDTLGEAFLVTADTVYCTGGTAKSIAKVLGQKVVGRDEVAGLENRVAREGPPSDLKPDRAEVFLPGLMVLHRLLLHTNADRLHYLKIPVGRMFMKRFADRIPARGTPQRKNYVLDNLRITSVFPRRDAVLSRPESAPPPEGGDEKKGADGPETPHPEERS